MPIRFFCSLSRSWSSCGAFLLRHLFLGVVKDRLELLETLDRLADGREIRQRATEPAVVHVEHAAAVGFFENRVLRLALGADEQDALALGREIGNERGSFFKELQRFLQIDDVDPIALAEDVLLHLRIPALGLMTEVHASFQKLFHRNRDRQVNPPLRCDFKNKTKRQERSAPVSTQVLKQNQTIWISAWRTGSGPGRPSVRTSCAPSCAGRA